jgi:hypothetical protein
MAQLLQDKLVNLSKELECNWQNEAN